MISTPKHIGIVACRVEGAALCFREISSYSLGRMGEHMHTIIVAKAGAQLAICPDNSAHLGDSAARTGR